MKSPKLLGGVLPEANSGSSKPLPPGTIDSRRDDTAGQLALRLLMMMVGSAGLAADRSLFWTILTSYARKTEDGTRKAPGITGQN